jgi:hypothetical protein
MLMKTGLSALAEPSSLPENSDSRRWPSHQVLSRPVNEFSCRKTLTAGRSWPGTWRTRLKRSRAFAKQQYSATLGCGVTREATAVQPIYTSNWRVFSYLNTVGYHRNMGCSPRRVADGVSMQNTRRSSLWLVAGPCSSLCVRRGLSPRLLCGASLSPDSPA